MPIIISTVDGTDPQTVVFDAGFSVDETGFTAMGNYTYEWTFPDGSTETGVRISHTFETLGQQVVTLNIVQDGTVVADDDYVVQVEDRDFLMLDFENGLQDLSDYDSDLTEGGAQFAASADGTGIRIGGANNALFGTTRDNDQYHDLESFGFSIDMAVDGNSAGNFLRFGSVLDGRILQNGAVSLKLTTDEGTFQVTSGALSVHDGLTHTIAFGYSDALGTLVMSIDGEVVGETAASGVTAAMTPHGILLGSPWNTTVQAVVSDPGADPEVVGLLVPEGSQAPEPPSKGSYEIGPPVSPESSTDEGTPDSGPVGGPAKDNSDTDADTDADTSPDTRVRYRPRYGPRRKSRYRL